MDVEEFQNLDTSGVPKSRWPRPGWCLPRLQGESESPSTDNGCQRSTNHIANHIAVVRRARALGEPGLQISRLAVEEEESSIDYNSSGSSDLIQIHP